ncbi:hypothetical protein P7C73_g6212, partial [Tremellales sp. Uapishka_1]
MTSYIGAMLGADPDMLSVPLRFLSSLSRDARLDNIVSAAIRMVLVGAAVSLIRRLVGYLSGKIERYLFPSAYIAINDASYAWISAWIAQDASAQAQIHDFELSTAEWRQIRNKSAGALTARSAGGLGGKNASWTSKHIIGQILPTYWHNIRIKHEGQYLWVTRKKGFFARSINRTEDHYQIRTFRFQKNALKRFLVAAHRAFYAKGESELLIFHSKRLNAGWFKPVSRPARPWASVILPGNVAQNLLGDIERFLSDKETSWYAARGIPHRRGYLFHGPPGAGKTTLATALASKLRLDIYVVNPSQRGMDDSKLSKLFRDCPSRSVVLIEDIDCVLPRRPHTARQRIVIRDEDADEDSGIGEMDVDDTAQHGPGASGQDAAPKGGLPPSSVTLSGMLNAIDGVSSQEGCILIATTNHLTRLDPALSRPGRFDLWIPFYDAVPEQARALFAHFYPFEAEDLAEISNEKDSSAQRWIQADLDGLADEFTSTLFPTSEREKVGGRDGLTVSMTALQGYLLEHKDAPKTAVEQVGAWIDILEAKRQEEKATYASHTLKTRPAKAASKKKAGQGNKEPQEKKDRAGKDGVDGSHETDQGDGKEKSTRPEDGKEGIEQPTDGKKTQSEGEGLVE